MWKLYVWAPKKLYAAWTLAERGNKKIQLKPYWRHMFKILRMDKISNEEEELLWNIR